MQRPVSLFALLLFTVAASSQAINGFWKGTLVMEPGGCFPVYNIEFQLQISGSRVTGSSYHYSDTTNYVKEEFEGMFDTTSKALSIDELRVSVFRIPPDCIPCIKKYNLTFHTDGKEEQLRGSWAGTIVMTRIQKPAFKPDLPPALMQRKNELVREIKVENDSVRLDFYDNGQIDGDTISVYVNNVQVVFSKMLTAKPLTIYIRINPLRPTQEVIMVGENLGSIPPNTALMMINSGDKRYQLYLSQDEKKNSLVRFIFDRPK